MEVESTGSCNCFGREFRIVGPTTEKARRPWLRKCLSSKHGHYLESINFFTSHTETRCMWLDYVGVW